MIFLFYEFVKFVIYSGVIVLISKYILVRTLRNLAENLNLKPKTVGDIAGYATSVPELLTISASSIRGLTSASIYNIYICLFIKFNFCIAFFNEFLCYCICFVLVDLTSARYKMLPFLPLLLLLFIYNRTTLKVVLCINIIHYQLMKMCFHSFQLIFVLLPLFLPLLVLTFLILAIYLLLLEFF